MFWAICVASVGLVVIFWAFKADKVVLWFRKRRADKMREVM